MAKKSSKSLDQLNETGNRKVNRRKESKTSKSEPKNERKVQRRRLIDPTTCERDYSQDEIEFMQAMDEYKRTSGRMFPTCSEILEVLSEMGYRRLSPAELADTTATEKTGYGLVESDDEMEDELENILD